MEKDWEKTHVGQLTVVTDTVSTCRRHIVAAEETEHGIRVDTLYGAHQTGGVEIARGFTGYKVILHDISGEYGLDKHKPHNLSPQTH